MKPILIQLGPLPISSLGVFLLLAFIAAIATVRRRAPAVGLQPSEVLDASLWMILAGIAGGRLGYAITNLPAFFENPIGIVAFWRDSGLSFYAALVGGAVVAAGFARARNLSLRRLADIFAPGLALGFAIAMIGALLHGLYLGRPTGVPWGVRLAFESRHPTQVYLLLASLGTYAVLTAQERRGAPPGTLFFLWLLLYSVARVAVEFFVESPAALGPFTLAQVAGVVAAGIAIAGLVVTNKEPAAGPAVATPPTTPS